MYELKEGPLLEKRKTRATDFIAPFLSPVMLPRFLCFAKLVLVPINELKASFIQGLYRSVTGLIHVSVETTR